MPDKFEELRKKAERNFRKSDTDISKFSDQELEKIFHDLEVHQIELEMQNDELNNTKTVLEETNEKYFNLFEFAPVGYLIVDKNKIVKEVNFTFCKLVGFDKKEILNLPFSNLIHPDYQDTFYLKFRNSLINEKPIGAEIQINACKDTQIWIKLKIIKQHQSENFLISVTNISEQKEAERKLQQHTDELKQLNTDKDLFIRILAHDLKNPFNSMLGFLNLLLKHLHSYDINKVEKQLNIIYSAAQRTFNLLNDLLIWSKSQAGKMPFDPEDVNFYTIYKEVESQFANNNKQIAINYKGAKDVKVIADLNMLKTILRNLISNAIKFTEVSGTINIKIAIKNKLAEVVVSDTGVGISKEKQQQIWEIAHYQTTPGTEGERGTGFGLHLCKQFVELQGGEIRVESELRKGSNFIFTIPLSKN